MFENGNIFSRCTYDYFQKGMPTPEKRVYILRCGCGPYDALEQVVEDYKYNAPSGCSTRINYRTVIRDDMGGKSLIESSIEYVDESGDVVFGIFNLSADEQQYTREYLAEHPELLPDEDVEGFKAAYAYYDKVKNEGTSSASSL